MSSDYPQPPMPWWIKAVIIIAMLPVLAYPWLIAGCPDTSVAKTFVWLYPAYVLAAGICAWMCWRRRPEVTVILIVLLLLTHGAMWFLIQHP